MFEEIASRARKVFTLPATLLEGDHLRLAVARTFSAMQRGPGPKRRDVLAMCHRAVVRPRPPPLRPWCQGLCHYLPPRLLARARAWPNLWAHVLRRTPRGRLFTGSLRATSTSITEAAR